MADQYNTRADLTQAIRLEDEAIQQLEDDIRSRREGRRLDADSEASHKALALLVLIGIMGGAAFVAGPLVGPLAVLGGAKLYQEYGKMSKEKQREAYAKARDELYAYENGEEIEAAKVELEKVEPKWWQQHGPDTSSTKVQQQ
jgi:hypothetical protein